MEAAVSCIYIDETMVYIGGDRAWMRTA